jgi:REP element-mobilizing transposase RayT
MPQSFACLNDHLIFSTRNREPLISAELRPRLFEYVGGLLRAERGCLLAAEAMPDHAHWLISLHQQTSVSDALRLIKANSSRWIHETFENLGGFAWQTGYGAFSVSFSRVPHVKRYLAGQEEHHRTTSFKEEFLEFLKRHHVPYDERYIWD